MKKFLTTLLLAATSLAASAQGNEQMDSLFAMLERHGINVDRRVQNHDARKEIITSAFLSASQPKAEMDSADVERWVEQTRKLMEEDGRAYDEAAHRKSIHDGWHRDYAKNMEEYREYVALVDSVCRVLDHIATTATESYRFVTHGKAGGDTIQYAICIDPGANPAAGTAKVQRGSQYSYYNAKEAISLHFADNSAGSSQASFYLYSGRLEYTVVARDTLVDQRAPFDIKGFENMVHKTLKGMTRRAIHWRYPHVADRESFDWQADYRMIEWGDSREANKGETHGIVFSLPADKASEAEAYLQQFADSVYNYFDSRDNFSYGFELQPSYHKRDLATTHWFQYYPDYPDYTRRIMYRIAPYCDDQGYHIFLLSTEGCFRLPRDFATLKTFVDGKKVYIK